VKASSLIHGNGDRNVYAKLTWEYVVNDRPVGNPKRRFDEYSIKFSLSYETKVINPVGGLIRLKVMPASFMTASDNL
jgi:hypothetical protein